MKEGVVSGAIEIRPIKAFQDNYIWACIHDRRTWLIDPGEYLPVVQFLEENQYILEGILITHHHLDHIGAVLKLAQKRGGRIIGPEHCQQLFELEIVKDGEIVELIPECLSFQIIAVPGHTLDHLAYYGNHLLFCGDTLFSGGCGRIFEGTAKMLFNSLARLKELPDETKIYCAHEYTLRNLEFGMLVEPDNLDLQKRVEHVNELHHHNIPSLPSTLFLEKKTNPFLRCHLPEVKEAVEKHFGETFVDPLSVFTALRLWKDQF